MVPSSDDKLPRGLKRPYSSGFQQVKLEVIFTDVKTIPPYLDLHEEAEIMLDAGKNDLQEDQLEDKFVYANPRGLSILEQLEKLDRQTNITQFQLATVTREVAGLNRQQKESDQKIRALTKSSEGYRKSNHIVVPGNIMAAHDGDVIAGANLYMMRIRNDIDTFSDLYGISPTRAADLDISDDCLSIRLLNARATLKAKKGLNISASAFQDWNSAFLSFASILEQTRDKPYEFSQSHITRAYVKF